MLKFLLFVLSLWFLVLFASSIGVAFLEVRRRLSRQYKATRKLEMEWKNAK